jgi:dihydroorotase
MVRAAKAEGLDVTAEATPHHLALTHALCAGFDPVFKVNPPLRTDADVAAVVAGVLDGTIDAIATDHAPHVQEAKERPFDQAPPGMLGLETALGVAVTELSKQGDVDWVQLLALLSWQPAAIAGLGEHAGTIVEGRAAHLCVIDPTAVWAVDAAKSASLSRNTPWAGRRLTGRVRHTLLAGEPVVVDGEATR